MDALELVWLRVFNRLAALERRLRVLLMAVIAMALAQALFAVALLLRLFGS